MEEIRTVIRDQGLKNTQLLEVMAKQQSEAQAAAAAAMTAQNEALRNFQDTIASVVVPLSSRPPTAVHMPEKDPKFPDWDGDRTHLVLWLHQVDQIYRPRKSRTPWQYVSPDMQSRSSRNTRGAIRRDAASKGGRFVGLWGTGRHPRHS